MRLNSTLTLGAIAATAVVLTGCNSVRQGLGLERVTPDEFRVISQAPLSVPPEYGLRPPAPGQPRPAELAPESSARQILLGQRQAITRSAGEESLVSAAGAAQADPLARYVIDDEFGDLAHKEEGWANRVLFWRRGDAASQGATQVRTPDGVTTIDPATEAARLQALTGGRDVVIQRGGGGIKLPGL
ncbi:DUF3035 domain-containing protein [Brevundimonas sp. BAL450]|jgi:hypothetical protein|uniref:Beta-barrel assembly machine subunit BamF n=1 Tax=Brevundimonas abyssalis TAR-001 TaxID=1391729 RepID=A0A8E0KJN6_9CAUL|nr:MULTISPECIES: DUF3035 domain-containing protein [Brevundimonas]MBG7616360.1 DUF3035 domain-containing protein [Brevundimonas sp. BAL450]GAD58324.1 hypothetical protein MBEBAB_0574 [Brevundimonas abyssalis TAR-001]